MIAVILAGGSGSRLWPLSTPDKPKHLLALHGEHSLLQDAFDRAHLFADEVYVVTDHSHAELVKEQLVGQLSGDRIIIEPDRRGTASCITLALAKLKAEHGSDVSVGFIHADHHILDKEGFAQTVTSAGKCADTHQSIALIGITPDYPATGFGYIRQGKKLDSGCYQVDAFQEKPDPMTAESYLQSGKYLWNLGLFSGSVGVFEQALKTHAPDLRAAFDTFVEHFKKGTAYTRDYKALEEEAIDTKLIEKVDNIVVVPGKFDWMDIGSYKDLHEALPKSDEHANAIDGNAICIDTTESVVIEQTGRPVAVLGLENIAVISTDKGLLICHKEYSQRVKEVAKVFNNQEN